MQVPLFLQMRSLMSGQTIRERDTDEHAARKCLDILRFTPGNMAILIQ